MWFHVECWDTNIFICYVIDGEIMLNKHVRCSLIILRLRYSNTIASVRDAREPGMWRQKSWTLATASIFTHAIHQISLNTKTHNKRLQTGERNVQYYSMDLSWLHVRVMFIIDSLLISTRLVHRSGSTNLTTATTLFSDSFSYCSDLPFLGLFILLFW